VPSTTAIAVHTAAFMLSSAESVIAMIWPANWSLIELTGSPGSVSPNRAESDTGKILLALSQYQAPMKPALKALTAHKSLAIFIASLFAPLR